VSEWLRAVSTLSPGVGDDLRLAGGGAAGAALLHGGVVVHAVLHRVAEQA